VATSRRACRRRRPAYSSIEGRIGATPYARWLSSFGLWPLMLLALALLFVRCRRGLGP
jgi:MYXO-CTERM domain-containing protein